MRWTEPLPFRRGSAREPAKASRREPPNSGARTLRSLSVCPRFPSGSRRTVDAYSRTTYAPKISFNRLSARNIGF